MAAVRNCFKILCSDSKHNGFKSCTFLSQEEIKTYSKTNSPAIEDVCKTPCKYTEKCTKKHPITETCSIHSLNRATEQLKLFFLSLQKVNKPKKVRSQYPSSPLEQDSPFASKCVSNSFPNEALSFNTRSTGRVELGSSRRKSCCKTQKRSLTINVNRRSIYTKDRVTRGGFKKHMNFVARLENVKADKMKVMEFIRFLDTKNVVFSGEVTTSKRYYSCSVKRTLSEVDQQRTRPKRTKLSEVYAMRGMTSDIGFATNKINSSIYAKRSEGPCVSSKHTFEKELTTKDVLEALQKFFLDSTTKKPMDMQKGNESRLMSENSFSSKHKDLLNTTLLKHKRTVKSVDLPYKEMPTDVRETKTTTLCNFGYDTNGPNPTDSLLKLPSLKNKFSPVNYKKPEKLYSQDNTIDHTSSLSTLATLKNVLSQSALKEIDNGLLRQNTACVDVVLHSHLVNSDLNTIIGLEHENGNKTTCKDYVNEGKTSVWEMFNLETIEAVFLPQEYLHEGRKAFIAKKITMSGTKEVEEENRQNTTTAVENSDLEQHEENVVMSKKNVENINRSIPSEKIFEDEEAENMRERVSKNFKYDDWLDENGGKHLLVHELAKWDETNQQVEEPFHFSEETRGPDEMIKWQSENSGKRVETCMNANESSTQNCHQKYVLPVIQKSTEVINKYVEQDDFLSESKSCEIIVNNSYGQVRSLVIPSECKGKNFLENSPDPVKCSIYENTNKVMSADQSDKTCSTTTERKETNSKLYEIKHCVNDTLEDCVENHSVKFTVESLRSKLKFRTQTSATDLMKWLFPIETNSLEYYDRSNLSSGTTRSIHYHNRLKHIYSPDEVLQNDVVYSYKYQESITNSLINPDNKKMSLSKIIRAWSSYKTSVIKISKGNDIQLENNVIRKHKSGDPNRVETLKSLPVMIHKPLGVKLTESVDRMSDSCKAESKKISKAKPEKLSTTCYRNMFHKTPSTKQSVEVCSNGSKCKQFSTKKLETAKKKGSPDTVPKRLVLKKKFQESTNITKNKQLLKEMTDTCIGINTKSSDGNPTKQFKIIHHNTQFKQRESKEMPNTNFRKQLNNNNCDVNIVNTSSTDASGYVNTNIGSHTAPQKSVTLMKSIKPVQAVKHELISINSPTSLSKFVTKNKQNSWKQLAETVKKNSGPDNVLTRLVKEEFQKSLNITKNCNKQMLKEMTDTSIRINTKSSDGNPTKQFKIIHHNTQFKQRDSKEMPTTVFRKQLNNKNCDVNIVNTSSTDASGYVNTNIGSHTAPQKSVTLMKSIKPEQAVKHELISINSPTSLSKFVTKNKQNSWKQLAETVKKNSGPDNVLTRLVKEEFQKSLNIKKNCNKQLLKEMTDTSIGINTKSSDGKPTKQLKIIHHVTQFQQRESKEMPNTDFCKQLNNKNCDVNIVNTSSTDASGYVNTNIGSHTAPKMGVTIMESLKPLQAVKHELISMKSPTSLSKFVTKNKQNSRKQLVETAKKNSGPDNVLTRLVKEEFKKSLNITKNSNKQLLKEMTDTCIGINTKSSDGKPTKQLKIIHHNTQFKQRESKEMPNTDFRKQLNNNNCDVNIINTLSTDASGYVNTNIGSHTALKKGVALVESLKPVQAIKHELISMNSPTSLSKFVTKNNSISKTARTDSFKEKPLKPLNVEHRPDQKVIQSSSFHEPDKVTPVKTVPHMVASKTPNADSNKHLQYDTNLPERKSTEKFNSVAPEIDSCGMTAMEPSVAESVKLLRFQHDDIISSNSAPDQFSFINTVTHSNRTASKKPMKTCLFERLIENRELSPSNRSTNEQPRFLNKETNSYVAIARKSPKVVSPERLNTENCNTMIPKKSPTGFESTDSQPNSFIEVEASTKPLIVDSLNRFKVDTRSWSSSKESLTDCSEFEDTKTALFPKITPTEVDVLDPSLLERDKHKQPMKRSTNYIPLSNIGTDTIRKLVGQANTADRKSLMSKSEKETRLAIRHLKDTRCVYKQLYHMNYTPFLKLMRNLDSSSRNSIFQLTSSHNSISKLALPRLNSFWRVMLKEKIVSNMKNLNDDSWEKKKVISKDLRKLNGNHLYSLMHFTSLEANSNDLIQYIKKDRMSNKKQLNAGKSLVKKKSLV